MDQMQAREWHMFLGTRDSDSASAELTRLVQRLDDAFDSVNYVVRLITGSPSAAAEENLRVARTAINESTDHLQDVANAFRRDDTGVA